VIVRDSLLATLEREGDPSKLHHRGGEIVRVSGLFIVIGVRGEVVFAKGQCLLKGERATKGGEPVFIIT